MTVLSLILTPLVLGISLAAPVGPVKLEMIKKGLAGGFWPCWLTGLGALTADLLYIISIAGGLLPIFKNPAVSAGLTVIGVYLLFKLGIKSIHSFFHKEFVLDSPNMVHSLKKSFASGFLIAFSNPFNFLFWFGIYGAALSRFPAEAELFHMALYSFFIVFGIFLWNLNVAFTVHFARRLISIRVIKTISLAAGVMLLAFSCKLAWDFISAFL
ncbi:amino acid transporter [Bacillus sp. FJAT-42376]|uniref:LysE family translocator n=1 Tax=Bacillus sp. FJAT-42376 TaxID=2014076 RepID=UPI000F4E4B3C|nr:LysE family transporter [Bacillus sp. FJAT-42376]AZB42652.1 amino acid transporter [Bacillus sp. FJAT-42376]